MLSQLIAARRRTKPQFKARNGIIIDPSGQEFQPIGANIGTDRGFDWRGVGAGHADDALEWGWNCVRFNILATNNISYSWLANNPGGLPAFIDYLDTYVEEYTSRGIAVHFGPHDDPKASGFDQTAYEQEMLDFFVAAATRWKDNPYVWYNPINEPRYRNAEWVALHDKFCDAIRSSGAKAPIILDAPGVGQDTGPLSWVGLDTKYSYEADMAPVLNKKYKDIIIACHNYGARWDTNAKVTEWVTNIRNAGLTPLFDEFGYTIDGTSTAGDYTANYNAALATFYAYEQLGVGISWWHGTHGDNYSLKLNGQAFWYGGNSAGLSDAGQRMWALTHDTEPVSLIPKTIPFMIGA